METTNEGNVDSSSVPQVIDSEAPSGKFGAPFGGVFGRDVEQFQRDAEAALLNKGAD
ncbi:hypothetical protein PQQ96_40900 [Paraburkholderia sediminicola]|uniref:hypothetical protein n=1 Tax=Paraburkholderia sediminicola TaxID=458836 RepID=UPI0038B6B381